MKKIKEIDRLRIGVREWAIQVAQKTPCGEHTDVAIEAARQLEEYILADIARESKSSMYIRGKKIW